ncbi:hypothetical protein ACN4EE_01340 [Geminocystis sp. CENA526]|uniref:hypothetical protein n=1 Tax=Geminocystis sp. CENA526 TaxID=1355871 RepID=UPI003D6E85E2
MKTLKSIPSIFSLISTFWLLFSANIAHGQVVMSGSYTETRMNNTSISATVQSIIHQPIDGMIGTRLMIEHVNPGTFRSSIGSISVIAITNDNIFSMTNSQNKLNLPVNNIGIVDNPIQNINLMNHSSSYGGLE